MRKLSVVVFLLIGTIVHAQNAVEYYNKANVQYQYKNYEDALRLLTRAVAIKPDFADAYALRGDCNYLMKAFDKAIVDYLEDDKLKKNRSSYNLACMYALTGKKDEAFKALENHLGSEYRNHMAFIQNDSDLSSLRSDSRWESLTKKSWYSDYEKAVHDGDRKVEANDIQGALASYSKAISIDSKNSRAYGSRAVAHLRSGDLQKSLQDLTEAIALDPKSVFFGNRGYVNNKLGNNEQSLADYEKAIVLDPTNLVYYDLAIARYLSGNKAAALDAILKHMDYFTQDEMGYYFGGIIASETERFPEAIDYYNRAIAINGTEAQFFMKRGDVFFLQKKYDEAVKDYSTVIQMNPASGEAYYIRGNAKASLIDRAGACADWKKAQELGFEDSNGYIRDLCK
jgi:tetratricopeptide (TPR) repeat protein